MLAEDKNVVPESLCYLGGRHDEERKLTKDGAGVVCSVVSLK